MDWIEVIRKNKYWESIPGFDDSYLDKKDTRIRNLYIDFKIKQYIAKEDPDFRKTIKEYNFFIRRERKQNRKRLEP